MVYLAQLVRREAVAILVYQDLRVLQVNWESVDRRVLLDHQDPQERQEALVMPDNLEHLESLELLDLWERGGLLDLRVCKASLGPQEYPVCLE